MSAVYSAREARTRFAELLRRVRSGETVAISYRGASIAEMRPPIAEAPPPIEPIYPAQDAVADAPPEPSLSEEETEARMADMRRRGILYPSSQPKRPFKPVCRSPGALARFLADRD